MYRSKTCGELRLSDAGSVVTLAGWVPRSRKMGGMTFVDIRDRYGITQLVFNEEVNAALCEEANKLGREYVIQVTGTVNERFSKNKNLPTGDIEIIVGNLNVLNASEIPPFTIEYNTDGGDELRPVRDARRNAASRPACPPDPVRPPGASPRNLSAIARPSTIQVEISPLPWTWKIPKTRLRPLFMRVKNFLGMRN